MTRREKVQLGRCNLGVWPFPYFLNGYIHIEACNSSASIKIEDRVWINNNEVIVSERSCNSIGANTLIGTEFTVYDSDFHYLQPSQRMAGTHQCASVSIDIKLFIGSRVMVMKVVVIGDNSVIASGAVITHSFPANFIPGGVPAKVIRYLRSNEKQEGYL